MRVALTGGGTLGHVVPGVTVAEELVSREQSVFWIGSAKPSERCFVEKRGICFYAICSEKLRRYFSISNLLLPFKVCVGFFQARRILREEKADVLFSKGGYVSVPVVRAARSLGIPVVAHESDASCGLATRIAARFCQAVCLGDERASIHTRAPVRFTGNPVRRDIRDGDGLAFVQKHGIPRERPVVLVLGGSQGAQRINETIIAGMGTLSEVCEVVLQTGCGKMTEGVFPGLHQFESFDDEYKDALAAAMVVVSRAGAGAISELRSLGKPMILIPLGLDASRGDQISNALQEEKAGRAVVSDYAKAIENIRELIDNDGVRKRLSLSCREGFVDDSASRIADVVLEVAANGV